MRNNFPYRLVRIRVIGSALSLFLIALLVTGCTGNNGSSTTGQVPGTSSAVTGAAGGSATATDTASSCPTSNTTSFAKSKFVLHSGLAFGAFHRYLYKPFRAGTFQSGAHGRTIALVKAGAAALFIKREARLTYEDVQANPTLCRSIGQPMQQIGDKVQDAVDGLRHGDFSAISVLEGAIGGVESKSSSAGTPIQENDNPSLS
jgi:hypothetical protein